MDASGFPVHCGLPYGDSMHAPQRADLEAMKAQKRLTFQGGVWVFWGRLTRCSRFRGVPDFRERGQRGSLQRLPRFRVLEPRNAVLAAVWRHVSSLRFGHHVS